MRLEAHIEYMLKMQFLMMFVIILLIYNETIILHSVVRNSEPFKRIPPQQQLRVVFFHPVLTHTQHVFVSTFAKVCHRMGNQIYYIELLRASEGTF
jgi:hypothetical protein